MKIMSGDQRDAPISTIRQFQAEDAEACSRIIRACVSLDATIPLHAKEELLRNETADAMRRRAGLFLMAVCVADDRIAGVGGVDLNEIRMLYVDPACWHRGIGTALLSYLESFVPGVIFGDIFVSSSPGAADFYRSHGYQPGGEHVFAISDLLHIPTIFMTKRTNPQMPGIGVKK